MPRNRNRENKGLPNRWRWRHNAYYFQVPKGLEAQWGGKHEFRLGATLAEASTVWANRVQRVNQVRCIGELLDLYSIRVLPQLAPATQRSYCAALVPLRKVFGHMHLGAIRPTHIYGYAEHRPITAAHREIEVLSAAFTRAIEWGFLDRHPFKGQVRLKSPAKRLRYVADEELAILKCVAPPVLFAYIWLRELTGLRRADLLTLEMKQIREDGIHVMPRKTACTTGKRLLIEWSDELHQAVRLAIAARPKDITPWLFCTRRGECYQHQNGTAHGMKSLWQRAMTKALRIGLEQSFTDRDIRKKVASDAATLERAAALLGHADTRTTARYYRVGPERVRPSR